MPEKAPAKDELDIRYKDVRILREGTQIILPEDMSTAHAIEWLNRKSKEEEQVVSIDEFIDAYPLEGAYALSRVLEAKYGFTSLIKTPGFWQDHPPHMIGIEVEAGKTTQVPWGRMQVPNVDGFIETGFRFHEGRWGFVLKGQVKRKNEREINLLANMVRELTRKDSIYKGKALRVSFEADEESFDINEGPKFIDTTAVIESDLIFSDEVMKQVTVNLFTPVERTALCKEYEIPLKRGVLMEGPYGTGKTLTATIQAKKCVDNGWTFMYLKNVAELPQALAFARQYQPAVIFAEDVDSVLEGDRDSAMNEILNTIDGIESKNAQVLVVLTSNHVDKIHKAMLRPGRLDAVISIRPPDKKAVAELIKLYGRGLIGDGEDLLAVGEKLAGRIPAVIREVVERAKLAAVSRLNNGDKMRLTKVDLLTSAEGMLAHLKLLEEPKEDKTTAMEHFGNAVGKHLVEGVEKAAKDLRNGHHKEIAAQSI